MPVHAASQPTSLPASQPTVRASTSTHEHREHPSPRHRCRTSAHDVAAVSPRVSLSQKLGRPAGQSTGATSCGLRTQIGSITGYSPCGPRPTAMGILYYIFYTPLSDYREPGLPHSHTPAPLVRHRHGCSSRPNACH